ncbi:MAG TPA: hypothetical protein VIN59_00120 [Alphaproteobacteria bacterium]
MALPKNTRIKIAMSALIIFAAASIMYFNGVLQPTNNTSQLNSIQSNAGFPAENVANGPALAQFKADCTLNNGTQYQGTISVQALQSPQDLKAVELKTNTGDMVRFAQSDAKCTYSPY